MTQQNQSTPNPTQKTASCDKAGGCGCATESTRSSSAVFHPGVDVIETSQEYLIHADVPGASAEGIDVNFEDGVLRVKAAVPSRRTLHSRVLFREYSIGDYERTFKVSGHVDADHISAELKQGVLTLRLPKADAVKPRKITVHSNN